MLDNKTCVKMNIAFFFLKKLPRLEEIDVRYTDV